ncbi:cation-transporting P-type ATPase [Candidatus Poribacteria bacterium]|nr:cation-transporting P-type ATPase [Candidatus Poribacteria bacterium]
MNIYEESISFLINQYDTDLEYGLSKTAVKDLQDRHGINKTNTKTGPVHLTTFIQQILNWRLLLLAITIAVFTYTNNFIVTALISGIFLVTLIGGMFLVIGFRYSQKRRVEKFKVSVSVIREGKQEKCDPIDIVPGDLIILKPGDYIPADARIVEADGLTVNESALFGSSGSAAKTTIELTEPGLSPEKQINMVFGGTYVDTGIGQAIVVRTGEQLEMFQNQAKARSLPNEMTVAENQLKFFIDVLKIAGIVVGGIAVAILWWGKSQQNTPNWVDLVQFGLIFAIAATPFNLVLLLHSYLNQKTSKLVNSGIVLRNHHFLEKLNRLTALCTDERGITSTRSLTISNIFTDEQIVNRTQWENWVSSLENQSPEEKDEKIHSIAPGYQIPQGAPGLILTAGLGTSGERFYDRSDLDHAHQQVIQETMDKLGFQLNNIKTNMQLVAEYPWTPNFGYELHVFESGDEEYLNIIFGDARNVLEACDSILVNGEMNQFNYDQYEMCSEILNFLQNSRDTVYGVASLHSDTSLSPQEVQGLSTFLGFISFSVTDNVETKEVVKSFLDTGLKVILISESDEQSTTDIAKELGLVHTRNAVATRQELMQLTTQEFDQDVPNWNAYSQPTDEQRRNVVLSLKRHNHTVGYLGQNANDQRAMVSSDLAFADAKNATHFAQDHADCLIIDQGFKAIKDSLLLARETYHNLSGSLRWCFSCTFAQFFTAIFGLILYAGFKIELPFTLSQIIWVQFLTTMLPIIGLGYEKLTLNDRKHHQGRATQLLPNMSVLDIICRSLVISLMTIIHFLVLTTSVFESTLEEARTAACTTLILTQIIVYFQCTRYPWESLFKRMFSNIRFLILSIILIGIQLGVIYLESVNGLFQFLPLQNELIVTALCGLILLLLPLNLAINPRKDRIYTQNP